MLEGLQWCSGFIRLSCLTVVPLAHVPAAAGKALALVSTLRDTPKGSTLNPKPENPKPL